MVDGRKPMPKNEQVVHIWRYWSISDPEPYTLKRSFTDNEGNVTKSEKVIVNKTTVDEILYKIGVFSVNTIQSFLSLLKNASVTSYDKAQDKNNRLKDYGVIPINPVMDAAYKISDQRYYDNAPKIQVEISVNMAQLVEDLGNVTDEEPDDPGK